jgi:hypothetical protein
VYLNRIANKTGRTYPKEVLEAARDAVRTIID